MAKRRKIIFFSRDMNIGGMEKALVLLLNELALLNRYDITLVLENKEGPLLGRLSSDITVEEYRLSGIKSVVFRKISNFLHRAFWCLKNRNKYDFSCNYATYSTIGSRLAVIASRNSSLYVHSDYYDYFSGDQEQIKSFFDMQGIKTHNHVIFVSDESEKKLKKIYPALADKFLVISNLIDARTVREESAKNAEFVIDDKKQKIVFVGRLDEHSKKLTRLLESFRIVCESSDEYILLIIGDGDYRALCEEYIQKHGLYGKVKMIGETENPYPYIKNADCLILTSDYEGFPVVYNECLVLNTPIMTTVPVSDKYLDFRNYSVVTPKESCIIARELLNRSYSKITFEGVEIDEVNRGRLSDLLTVIDEK